LHTLKPAQAGILFSFLLVCASYLVVLLGDARFMALTTEDGVIESLGALSFLVAALSFLGCWWLSHPLQMKPGFRGSRNLFYLLLALFFLVCAGEELSWGQRLFGWQTPEILLEKNMQQETNLHNLEYFHAYRRDGSRKSWLGMMTNMNRLFGIFWLSFCVVVPVVYRVSTAARSFLDRIRMPITPLWISALFLTHAFVFQVIYSFGWGIPKAALVNLNELKESNYAFIFAVLGVQQLNSILLRRRNTADGP